MIVYRKLNVAEEKLVLDTLEEWLGSHNLEIFIRGSFLLAGEGNWVEIFITNNETNALLEINPQITPYSVGLGLGEIKDEEFHLSLGGAFEIAKLSKKKVIINSEAEQLFLYQRNVLSKSIIFCDETFYEKERIFVMNEKGDCLGIGKLLLSAKELRLEENANKEALQNLMDLGWYLRKGK
ncbi:MAG TPA: PUA domain-containing protein [Candidatus Bathyarchaeia archaeon]|nr:PUA domain-containing protein [Candidatus Bathyarchaeia archaeon]